MTKIAVSVKRDHIEALAATKRPIVSLAELMWNSLDADADKVSVRFDENAVVLIDAKKEPTATRIFGPLPRELKEKGFEKLMTMAEEIV